MLRLLLYVYRRRLKMLDSQCNGYNWRCNCSVQDRPPPKCQGKYPRVLVLVLQKWFCNITAKYCHWCASFTILTTMVKEYICIPVIANICTVKINILAFPWWRVFTVPKMYNLVTNWHIKQSAAIKHRCFSCFCFQIPLYFAVDMRFSKHT